MEDGFEQFVFELPVWTVADSNSSFTHGVDASVCKFHFPQHVLIGLFTDLDLADRFAEAVKSQGLHVVPVSYESAVLFKKMIHSLPEKGVTHVLIDPTFGQVTSRRLFAIADFIRMLDASERAN